MKYSELTPAQIDAAMAEADEAISKMLAYMQKEGQPEPMLVMVDNVTRGIFQSQAICRTLEIPPKEWVQYYISTIATALLQFNWDMLSEQGKDKVAEATGSTTVLFAEYVEQAVATMMSRAPHIPAPSKH